MTVQDKKAKRNMIIFGILSFLITFVPIIIFYIKGWILGDAYSKMTLGITFTACLILSALSIIMKFKCRTLVWVMLLGVYVALGNIQSILVTLLICTAVDEFLLSPLYRHYRDEYKFRKTYRKVISEA